jgi:hypothetical protein
MKGILETLNYGPKGSIESLLMKCDGKLVQANFSPHAAASITKTETLLDQVADPILADLWLQIHPLRVDQLPDHQRIIADLADFAEVLQPHLNGMNAPHLCRLIGAYAAKHHRSQRFVRALLWEVGQNQVVANVQPGIRLEHSIADVGHVAAGL